MMGYTMLEHEDEEYISGLKEGGNGQEAFGYTHTRQRISLQHHFRLYTKRPKTPLGTHRHRTPDIPILMLYRQHMQGPLSVLRRKHTILAIIISQIPATRNVTSSTTSSFFPPPRVHLDVRADFKRPRRSISATKQPSS